MIGTALDARRARGLLRNLATLKAPWNCPHGRPTMRHVADLAKLRAFGEKGARAAGARKRSAPHGGWETRGDVGRRTDDVVRTSAIETTFFFYA